MLPKIVNMLMSDDPEEQSKASTQLREFSKQGLSVEDGLYALKSASQSFPDRKGKYLWDNSARLIYAAAENPIADYIPIISKSFSNYSGMAKESALMLLTKIPEKEALVVWIELLEKYAGEENIPHLATMELQKHPRFSEIIFPKILKFIDIKSYEWNINLLILEYLKSGLIYQDVLVGYFEKILSHYLEVEEKLYSMQKPKPGSWMWEDDYYELRANACLYLDILGFFSDIRVQSVLENTLRLTDPKIKLFGILGLLRLEVEIPIKYIMDVARQSETRAHLYTQLQSLNKGYLFPEELKNQSSFAETDLVNWLIYPTELGCAPDEIELMLVETYDTKSEDGVFEYYLFRFRTLEPHSAAKNGWMAGIAGPYGKNFGLSTSGTDTFSRFESWESKEPKEHLGDIQETMANWKKHHNR